MDTVIKLRSFYEFENWAEDDKLNSIEFEWMIYNWDEMYQQLQLYKNEHGNCYVPRKYKSNLSLGRWVATQRTQYQAKETGGRNSTTEKQIVMLDSIGFLWTGN